ncbi:hypothetical protein FDP41_009658 [Naegleria fowleri]|uniref:Uncharacterized protein n=1 Tax=Naegleria fowleri TaxID=5763 RepID=A0A6A5BA23_NAEFO|nr:uncharacterized protein FDP41_009658 [Naegleria fowleri]KAF0971962.1 hypothetical protein FDP41_009658 [Naegleria fowleri]CAG4709147.1 unnamed protein product [Naegleria fowleri]
MSFLKISHQSLVPFHERHGNHQYTKHTNFNLLINTSSVNEITKSQSTTLSSTKPTKQTKTTHAEPRNITSSKFSSLRTSISPLSLVTLDPLQIPQDTKRRGRIPFLQEEVDEEPKRFDLPPVVNIQHTKNKDTESTDSENDENKEEQVITLDLANDLMTINLVNKNEQKQDGATSLQPETDSESKEIHPPINEVTSILVNAIDELNTDTRRSQSVTTPDLISNNLNRLLRSESRLSEISMHEKTFNTSNISMMNADPSLAKDMIAREKAQLVLKKFLNDKEREERNKLKVEKLRKEIEESRANIEKWREKKELQNTSIRKSVKMTKELIKERDMEMEIIRKIKSIKRRKGSNEAKEKLKSIEDHSKFFVCQNNMLAKQMIAKHALKKRQLQLEENFLNVYEKRMKEVQSKAQTDALNLYELDEKKHINRKRKEIALSQLDMVKQAQVEKLQTKMLKVKVDKYLGELEKSKRQEELRMERELRSMQRKQQKEAKKLEKESQQRRNFKFIKELSMQEIIRQPEKDDDQSSDSSYFTESDGEDAPIVIVMKSQKPAVGNINIDLSKINTQRPCTDSEKYDTARSSLSARLSIGNFSPRVLDQNLSSQQLSSPRDFETSSLRKEHSNLFNTIGISSQFL